MLTLPFLRRRVPWIGSLSIRLNDHSYETTLGILSYFRHLTNLQAMLGQGRTDPLLSECIRTPATGFESGEDSLGTSIAKPLMENTYFYPKS